MAAIVLTRSARKWPSLSSASSASVTLSRPARRSGRLPSASLIHFTGRPVSLAASSTSGISLKIGDFMPNEPPVSPVTTRTCGFADLQELREFVARRVRTLHRGVQRVAAVGGLVDADRAARLHAGGGDAVDDQALLDDVRGGGKAASTAALSPIVSTKPILSGHSAHTRGAPGCVACAVEVTAGSSSYSTAINSAASSACAIVSATTKATRVADPAHALLGEDRIARLVHRRAVAPLEPAMHRQVAESRGLHVGRGEHRQHAGRRLRRRSCRSKRSSRARAASAARRRAPCRAA